MRRRNLAAICFGVYLLTMVSSLAAQKSEEPESYWMKKKLEYSKEILSGLSQEDFDLITRNAKSMNALGQLEKWFRANTPEYRAQLKSFRSANDQLIKQSAEKNLDGAALAYMQVTLSCVNCHRVIRNQPDK